MAFVAATFADAADVDATCDAVGFDSAVGFDFVVVRRAAADAANAGVIAANGAENVVP